MAGEGNNELPAGYRLHEFEIVKAIGEGGFSIVYLARDLQLQRNVALKEYIPSSLAARAADNSIAVRSERHRETFELGLRSFVNEGRLLASFDHPSLVKVYRFWEQNGTAYMVMPFYSGPTLKSMLKEMPGPPDETWLKQLLTPLLDALQIIHADSIYHRDIAPDNILLLGPQLKPLLLDFGAARRVIGDATQALTVILKPGYAPVEQYAEVPSMKQGAWTDVYALCAVLYMAITGRSPTASVGRLMRDELVPVSQSAQGKYSTAFLAAIDHGLAVRPEDRPQDITALRAELFSTGSAASLDVPASADENDRDSDATVIRPSSATPFDPSKLLAPAPPRFTSPAPSAPPAVAPATTPQRAESARASSAPAQPAGRSPIPWLAGVLAAIVAVAGGTWYAVGDRTPAPDVAKAPAPAPADAASASTIATAPPAAPTPAPTSAPVMRGEFSVVGVLEDIVRHSDPLISVNALADKETVVIDRDKIRFRVKGSDAGYLYVFFSGTGDPALSLLFPNALDKNNRIAADSELTLPRSGWNIDAAGPPGTDHIVALISRSPRDFSKVGLRNGTASPDFELAKVKELWASPVTADSPFAGTAACASGSPCPQEFGATLLRISEVKGGK